MELNLQEKEKELLLGTEERSGLGGSERAPALAHRGTPVEYTCLAPQTS